MSSALAASLALYRLFPTHIRPQIELIRRFGSADAVFRADAGELEQVDGLKSKQRDKILSCRDLGPYEAELDVILKTGTQVVTFWQEHYPKRLLEIASPPTVLFYRGDLKIFERESFLGVVGSREMTQYGRQALQAILPPVCHKKIVIVSGLAFGVDAWAHELALKHDCPTIAVQAQGVDKGYPRSHQELFERVVAAGCVISEFPSSPEGNEGMLRALFPRRNRIISGLSDGVLVVEAKEKSGALITARFAAEQNRNVYTVPGDIFRETSLGCLHLIREGAKPVARAADILEDFPGFEPEAVTPRPAQKKAATRLATDVFESPLEARIFVFCREGARTMDDILDTVPDSAASVSATITKMELTGRLQALAGRRFVAVE